VPDLRFLVTALAVLDDDAGLRGTDEHRHRWRTWLYWSNLLQFLSRAGEDGVQLITSQVDSYRWRSLRSAAGSAS
jgi:hypothetical protein